MVNWLNFILGEAELHLESKEDAELLLGVCKEKDIDCDYVSADDFEKTPYWYVNRINNELCTTRYTLESDYICEIWTVKEYIENHES